MVLLYVISNISTHALLAEGDQSRCMSRYRRTYFNPRPPYGGRLRPAGRGVDDHVISTHALLTEGDFNDCEPNPHLRVISTHALLTEGDISYPTPQYGSWNFNPRPPYGGRRLQSGFAHRPNLSISTHALLTEGDGANGETVDLIHIISTHALLTEGDLRAIPQVEQGIRISTHALLTEGDYRSCAEDTQC